MPPIPDLVLLPAPGEPGLTLLVPHTWRAAHLIPQFLDSTVIPRRLGTAYLLDPAQARFISDALLASSHLLFNPLVLSCTTESAPPPESPRSTPPTSGAQPSLLTPTAPLILTPRSIHPSAFWSTANTQRRSKRAMSSQATTSSMSKTSAPRSSPQGRPAARPSLRYRGRYRRILASLNQKPAGATMTTSEPSPPQHRPGRSPNRSARP